MKKGFLILFTFYFLFISVGIVFGSHYCGKKVSHTVWGISISKSKSCKCKHAPNSIHKKGCCKHETKWIKCNTDDSKIQATNFQINKIEVTAFSKCIIHLHTFSTTVDSFVSLRISHPPPISSPPFYILNRTILI